MKNFIDFTRSGDDRNLWRPYDFEQSKWLIFANGRNHMIKRTAMVVAERVFIGAALLICLAEVRLLVYIAELQMEPLRSSMHQQP